MGKFLLQDFREFRVFRCETRPKNFYTYKNLWNDILRTLGPSTKDVRQMGKGVVLKFRTFPDGGGGVVCESSDVRKFLKKSKFQNFSDLFKVKTRNYNR